MARQLGCGLLLAAGGAVLLWLLGATTWTLD